MKALSLVLATLIFSHISLAQDSKPVIKEAVLKSFEDADIHYLPEGCMGTATGENGEEVPVRVDCYAIHLIGVTVVNDQGVEEKLGQVFLHDKNNAVQNPEAIQARLHLLFQYLLGDLVKETGVTAELSKLRYEDRKLPIKLLVDDADAIARGETFYKGGVTLSMKIWKDQDKKDLEVPIEGTFTMGLKE